MGITEYNPEYNGTIWVANYDSPFTKHQLILVASKQQNPSRFWLDEMLPITYHWLYLMFRGLLLKPVSAAPFTSMSTHLQNKIILLFNWDRHKTL